MLLTFSAVDWPVLWFYGTMVLWYYVFDNLSKEKDGNKENKYKNIFNISLVLHDSQVERVSV